MGHKGVSKRKPKKSVSNDNVNHGASNARPGKSSSPVQALVNTKEAPLNRGGIHPATGSNKKTK